MTAGHLVRVVVTSAALEDLRSIARRHPPVLAETVRLLRGLERGLVAVQPLRNFGKTGDLSDCGKIRVIVDGMPEHRIVVHDLGDGGFEILDVVAVEERADDVVYLLAAVRLSRLSDPIRRSDVERRLARILMMRRPPEGDRRD